MREYIKCYLWEYFMCVLMATTLSMSIFQGFYIPDAAAGNILMAVAFSAALQAMFYIGIYNKKTICISGLLYILIIISVILKMRAAGVVIIDSPGSDTVMYIYYFVLITTGAVVFLFSRFRISIILLFLSGIYVIAGIDFLGFNTNIGAILLFTASCFTIYVQRQYRKNAINSSSITPNFFSSFLSGILAAFIALSLALGVYFAVIKPLEPAVMDIKLITKYMELEVLDMVGISRQYSNIDKNLQSHREEDWSISASEKGDEANDKQLEEEEPGQGNNSEEKDKSPLERGSGTDEDAIMRQSISYGMKKALILLMLLLPILLLALLPLLKRATRRIWMRKLSQQSWEIQICELYRYFLKKLRYVGFNKNAEETPFEFSQRNKERMRFFTAEEVDFSRLSEIFVAIRYGGKPVVEEEYRQYLSFYKSFCLNCKKQLGTRVYLKNYFRL